MIAGLVLFDYISSGSLIPPEFDEDLHRLCREESAAYSVEISDSFIARPSPCESLVSSFIETLELDQLDSLDLFVSALKEVRENQVPLMEAHWETKSGFRALSLSVLVTKMKLRDPFSAIILIHAPLPHSDRSKKFWKSLYAHSQGDFLKFILSCVEKIRYSLVQSILTSYFREEVPFVNYSRFLRFLEKGDWESIESEIRSTGENLKRYSTRADGTCSVCLDSFSTIRTQCGHSFCHHCIPRLLEAIRKRDPDDNELEEPLEDNPTCPICRAALNWEKISVFRYTPDIEKIKDRCIVCLKSKSEKTKVFYESPCKHVLCGDCQEREVICHGCRNCPACSTKIGTHNLKRIKA
jgi:RING-type zinc-finger